MSGRLEHANITVSDLDAALDFLLSALPDFRVRGSGVGPDGLRWVHVGSDASYVALNEAAADASDEQPGRWHGVNHLGFEVDDARAVRRRLLAKGYREGYVPESHPHRQRIYFLDGDGNEWEFVEYFSKRPEERNDYSLG